MVARETASEHQAQHPDRLVGADDHIAGGCTVLSAALVGESRFGVLVLVWLFVGYFEFFDFGIGKDTANHMIRLRDTPIADREAAFWTGALINGILGLLGGVELLAAGHYAVNAYFGDKLSGELEGEIRRALPWMAIAAPVRTVSVVGVAALEARERF